MIKQKLQREIDSMDVTDMLALYSYIQMMKKKTKAPIKRRNVDIEIARNILKKINLDLSKEIQMSREDRF